MKGESQAVVRARTMSEQKTERPEALAEFTLCIWLPVQWSDLDAFGHVNNTVAIRWFESSRIDYLRQSGLEEAFLQEGMGSILASISCDYQSQIYYPDTVCIGGRVSYLGNSSMKMKHAVYSVGQDAIVASGEGVVVAFDYAAQKPRRILPEMRQMLCRLESGLTDD